jgi:dynein heavy chain
MQHATAADVPSAPEDGILVHGLWLEGARWDGSAGCLAESQPGVMASPLPVVHYRPTPNHVAPAGDYQCPLYKTSARAGVLSTTGCGTNFVCCVSLPCPPTKGVDAWVLQGVALLCQLDS